MNSFQRLYKHLNGIASTSRGLEIEKSLNSSAYSSSFLQSLVIVRHVSLSLPVRLPISDKHTFLHDVIYQHNTSNHRSHWTIPGEWKLGTVHNMWFTAPGPSGSHCDRIRGHLSQGQFDTQTNERLEYEHVVSNLEISVRWSWKFPFLSHTPTIITGQLGLFATPVFLPRLSASSKD